MKSTKNILRIKLGVLIALLIFVSACNSDSYGKYFSEKRLRINYAISGTSYSQKLNINELIEEPLWGGSKVNLIDTFEYGKYLLKIYDKKSGKLIYSKGYSDLFAEWQNLKKDSVKMKHQQTLIFPSPKRAVLMEVLRRDSMMAFKTLFQYTIDLQTEIQEANKAIVNSQEIHHGDESSRALDVVMVSEGYTAKEKQKFYEDATRFTNYLLNWDPYDKNLSNININAVYVESDESGTDIPGENIGVNTCFGSHFSTFDVERYLTIPDLTVVYDQLSSFAVDQIVILVNSDKYGGGGIYNFYNIFTVDNEFAEQLFLHEFGHGFASLADEYYSVTEGVDSIQYEPYEPNITSLVDYSAKWIDSVHDTVPIPSPDVVEYDSVVGVFEGANYQSKGFYRPYRDCMMRSFDQKFFCPVCTKSIEEMIHFYSK